MVRMALIGAGKMGLSHLAIARAHPQVEIVAVCDASRYLLDILEKYSGFKTYTDYKVMLANEKLDAVIIATPSRSHGEIVRAALDLNLHVFCEKPFCLDIAEGKSLAELAAAKKRVNMVGYHYRFVGVFQEARRLLSLGALGKLHAVRAEAYGPVVLKPKGGTWRSSKAEGGGCLHDYASHAIDLLNYLVGPVAGVRGSVLNSIFSRDVEDEAYATLLYGNGMTGQLAVNWSDDSFRKMSMKISLWGEHGRISADRQEIQIYYRGPNAAALGLNEGWTVRYTTDLTREVWYYLRGEEYSAQIDSFVRQIAEGAAGGNAASFAAALDTDTTMHMIARDAAGETDTRIASPAKKGGLLGALGLKG